MDEKGGFDYYLFHSDEMSLLAEFDDDQKVKNTVDFDHMFDDVFVKFTNVSDLISIDSVRGWALTELVYNVDMKNPNKKQEFLWEIKKLNDNLNVTLITWYNTTDL